jgi:ribonuclease-3
VDQSTLQQCEELLGYKFNDTGLLALALTHASVAPTRVQSNERMEFLGDSVLGLVVCSTLYERHSELMEGEMTRIKSAVVSRQTCAQVAEKLGMGPSMLLGKGMSSPSGLPPSVAAALFEAVIGAVYLDGGLEPAREFILRNISEHLDSALADEHQRNYKSLLQQFAQRRWNRTPEYQLLDEKGPDHCKCFEIAVSIDGRQFPSAWGKNKKEAEQVAAKRALDELGENPKEVAEEEEDQTEA